MPLWSDLSALFWEGLRKRQFKRRYLEGHLEVPLQLSARFKTTLYLSSLQVLTTDTIYTLDSSIPLFLSLSLARSPSSHGENFTYRTLHPLPRVTSDGFEISSLSLRCSSRHPRSDVFPFHLVLISSFILPFLFFLHLLLSPRSKHSHIFCHHN